MNPNPVKKVSWCVLHHQGKDRWILFGPPNPSHSRQLASYTAARRRHPCERFRLVRRETITTDTVWRDSDERPGT